MRRHGILSVLGSTLSSLRASSSTRGLGGLSISGELVVPPQPVSVLVLALSLLPLLALAAELPEATRRRFHLRVALVLLPRREDPAALVVEMAVPPRPHCRLRVPDFVRPGLAVFHTLLLALIFFVLPSRGRKEFSSWAFLIFRTFGYYEYDYDYSYFLRLSLRLSRLCPSWVDRGHPSQY